MTFSIYDRWGEKVFETNSPSQGWDGTFKGVKLDNAVFVYYLKGKTTNGKDFSQKGSISLIR